MTTKKSPDPHLQLSVLRDEAALNAIRDEWTELEQQAATIDRFVTWSYVSLAWTHLRKPGDQLYVILAREAGRLVGVLPLVKVPERHYGLKLSLLRHIGIWEGERPGVLALGAAEPVWAGAWRWLTKHRKDWQVLDLRELDAESWPVRELEKPGMGFSAQVGLDVGVTYQKLREGGWEPHERQRSEALRDKRRASLQQLEESLPGVCLGLAQTPEDVRLAFSRYLVVEKGLVRQGGGITLGDDAGRVAFYREWLPMLAARGEAAVWLMGDGETDVAALIRLRCGKTWIERHACHDPDRHQQTPALLLCLEALQRSYADGEAAECSPVNIQAGPMGAPAIADWYDGRRPTRRLSVWNLRSKLAPVAMMRWVKNLRSQPEQEAPATLAAHVC